MEEQQPQLRWYHEHFALQQNGRKFFKVFKNVVYQAKYTDRVSKLVLRNCVQAHDNWLKVLAHINLDHSTGRPRTIGSSGHVTPSFLKFCISKNSVFQDQDIFCTKKHEKENSRGAAPSYRAALLPQNKVGAKCLAAMVLAHHNRVLSHHAWG